MRVLQINTVCGVTSTGRIMLQIHQALKQRGHQSYLAYGREPAKNCEGAIRIGTNFDVYHHVLLTRLFDLHGFGSKRATARFVQMIGKIDPDIIHLHNVHGYYLNIEVLFKFLKEFGKPIVWTLHDCWPFTGHCAHFLYAKCERWRTGCHSCPEKSSYPKSLLLDNSRWNYRKKKELFTDLKHLTIVTPSRWLAGLVKESFLSEYPVEVTPNGIDTNVFKPTPSDFRKKYGIEDKFIILGVANVWDRRKGFEYFLELSKFLSQREVIVLVGVNDRQMKTLPKNIIGIKRTNSPEELAQIYTAADIFLNPTLEDNYPTVNLEAQACGTFVVTFDSGGAAETILCEETGMILKEKTVEGILRAIGEIKSDSRRVEVAGVSTGKMNDYSKEIFTEKYLHLYESIVSK